MKRNKILSLALAAVLALALAVPAFAENTITTSGAAADATPVNITAVATTFNVTVPTQIDVTVNADSTVTCPAASAVTITNGSNGRVKVSSLAVNNGAAWAVASYNGGNRSLLAQETVGTKKMGLQFSATSVGADSATVVATSTDGDQTLNPNWIIEAAGVSGGNNTLPITTAAISTTLGLGTATNYDGALNVVFTIGWNT